MMSSHHEHEAIQFQVFSPFGPFRQTHPERTPRNVTQELHQLQPYPLSDRDGVSSSNSGHRHVCSGTPTTRTIDSADYLCNCRQLCYHAQQIICSTAVLAGLALVIVGAIYGNEHDNLLYIGILLMVVGFGLIVLTWDVHRKIRKRRMRNMSVPQPTVEDGAAQTTDQPLLQDTNRIVLQPSCNSHGNVTDTSPSEFRSIVSLQCQSSSHRQQDRYHHHHHHHHANQKAISHTSHQMPR